MKVPAISIVILGMIILGTCISSIATAQSDAGNLSSPFVHYRSQRYKTLGSDNVTCLALDTDNNVVYIGTAAGVFQIIRDEVLPLKAEEPKPLNIMSLLVTGSSNDRILWAGTRDGVWRFNAGHWSAYTAKVWNPALQDWSKGNSGLPGNTIFKLQSWISGDKEIILAATDNGPAAFIDGKWTALKGQWEDYNNTAILPFKNNILMIAGNPGKPGLYDYNSGKYKTFTAPNLPEKTISAVRDGSGTVYLATPDGISKLLVSDKSIVKLDEFAIPGPCTAVAVDTGGNLYVGSKQGLFYINVEEHKPLPKKISSTSISQIDIMPSKNEDQLTLWIASMGKGAWKAEIWESHRLKLVNDLLQPAREFIANGQNQHALDLLDKIIALDNSYAPAYAMAGSLHYHMRQFAQAIEYLEKANVLTGSAESGSQLAEAYFMVGRPELAVKKFRDILSSDPDNSSMRIGLVKALDLSGQPMEALREIVPLINQDSQEVEIIRMGADLALRTGRGRDAIKLHRRAIEKFPNDLRSYLNLAELLSSQGQNETAANLLRQALGIRENAEILSLLGRIATETRNFVEAESCLKRAMQIELEQPLHMARYVRLLAQQRYLDRAEAELASFMMRYPDDPNLASERGHMLMRRNQYLDAIEVFDRILATHEEFQPALFYKAKTLENLVTVASRYQREMESTLVKLINSAPWGPYAARARAMGENHKFNMPPTE